MHGNQLLNIANAGSFLYPSTPDLAEKRGGARTFERMLGMLLQQLLGFHDPIVIVIISTTIISLRVSQKKSPARLYAQKQTDG